MQPRRGAAPLLARRHPLPALPGLREVALLGQLTDLDPQVLTVLTYPGGLLRWTKDREHIDRLTGVAEGHAQHPDRRVRGRHG